MSFLNLMTESFPQSERIDNPLDEANQYLEGEIARGRGLFNNASGGKHAAQFESIKDEILMHAREIVDQHLKTVFPRSITSSKEVEAMKIAFVAKDFFRLIEERLDGLERHS